MLPVLHVKSHFAESGVKSGQNTGALRPANENKLDKDCLPHMYTMAVPTHTHTIVTLKGPQPMVSFQHISAAFPKMMKPLLLSCSFPS